MHTYHLFIIKKETYKLYAKNSYILFEILKNLYELEKENLIYGVSLYRQICIPISVNLLSNYISEKVPAIKLEKNTYKLLSFFEETIVSIRPSNIIVKSNQELSSIYKIFHVYHENIFVCDFFHHRFFWLDKRLKMETEKKRNI